MRLLEPEQILANLVHDLRQPLGTIETSACCLDMSLGHPQGQNGAYLRVISRQVDHAASILDAAAAELRRLRTQNAAGASSRDSTKPEIAAVT